MNENKSIDDIQVNVRFNKQDYDRLQDKFRKRCSKGKGKVPTIQDWIRELVLA